MERLDGPTARTLRGKPQALQWTLLLVLTVSFVSVLELVHLPAALMLGALIAAVVLSVYDGRVRVPRTPYILAQGLIGCLVARAIGPDILVTMLRQWPLFLAFVCAVILFSTVLGGLLAYWKVLPGTTAIWGSSPGGATVMVIMSESFGADIRLVAFMQFLRIAFVAALASAVARIWLPAGAPAPAAVEWFPAFAALPLLQTLAIAVGGAWLGTVFKVPAGAMLVPMFLGILFSGTQLVAITLPPWLMAGCYALVGWTIGLRFTRDVVKHAARAFPRIAASTLALVALCGGLAWLLHRFSGVDPLTAYLATSPGGADSVAIIAASSHVDMPFVMALQMARFLIVMALGPALARMVARWVEKVSPPASQALPRG
ncbi:MAG: AbrB family transcriptional regulator [Pseudomonadota bacterium]